MNLLGLHLGEQLRRKCWTDDSGCCPATMGYCCPRCRRTRWRNWIPSGPWDRCRGRIPAGSHPVPVVHHRRRTRRRPAELLSLELGLLAELKNVPLGVEVFGSCVGPVFLDLGSFRREANGGSAALVVSLGVAFVVGRIWRGCCGLFIAACRLGIAVMIMLRNGRQASLHRGPATDRRPEGTPSESRWRWGWCIGLVRRYVHLSRAAILCT